MDITEFSLEYPYLVVTLCLLTAVLGVYGYFVNPVELFPASDPPQVIIITTQPDQGPQNVEDNITRVIEQELYSISGIKNISSVSRDEVSSITAEFAYTKGMSEAVVDVQNVIARVRSELPADIREPRIYRLTEYTSRPLLTLAMRPGEDCRLEFPELRLLAENKLRDELLQLQGVADVDVFGGHQPEVQVRLDRAALTGQGLTAGEVIGSLRRRNITVPAGIIYSDDSEQLVRISGEFKNLTELRNLPLRQTTDEQINLGDVAEVSLAGRDSRSLYHGNGKKALALGVIRTNNGKTVETINRVKEYLPRLKENYPGLEFEITQDQQPLIDINMWGMFMSVLQAIIFTVLVIFLFLADFRASLIVGTSIPLSFLFALMVLWLSPFTMNMITLSGLIVAVGLVVDSSVVALENIYRHFYEDESLAAKEAAREGTAEIKLAITAGILTTVIVLFPIMFVGGYPQRTLGRLSFTINVTLLAALVAALSVVPLLCSRLLSRDTSRKSWLEKITAKFELVLAWLEKFYVTLVKICLRWRTVSVIVFVALFVLTMRLVPPILGNELMPPMDTGIISVKFETPAYFSPDRVEKTLNDVEEIIYKRDDIQRVSGVVGSEPGAIGFGSGGATAQSARLTVNLVDPTRRAESTWEIQEQFRRQMRQLPGIKNLEISAFGATPMATIRAPLDVELRGPDLGVLSALADRVVKKLQTIPGLEDANRSWHFDSRDSRISLNPEVAELFGVSTAKVADQARVAVGGRRAGRLSLERFQDIPLRVEYLDNYLAGPDALANIYVPSRSGLVPLRTFAAVEAEENTPFISRENLSRTINVTGVNRIRTIGHVTTDAREILSDFELPAGYELEVGGTMTKMRRTQQRLAWALVIGLVLIYGLLVSMFNSFLEPVAIMAIIPLAIAGGMWGMLIMDKPMCMPAIMGIIFVGGTKVNDSIMLLDFVKRARKEGKDRFAAIVDSIRVRLRPILMTTFSTVVGLSPLAFEMAVGLERMSPLAIVAGFGMLIGTFLTMVVVPVIYTLLDDARALIF